MYFDMSEIISFRDLIAWQKAMDLADVIYDLTEPFPKREWFGLSLQMRKAAVSIPSNIAEGNRHRAPSYVHHLTIALGSHGELDIQCELATRRRFIRAQDRMRLHARLADVGRLTHGLARSIDPNFDSRTPAR
jgi:four helix bundle protein